MHLQKIRIENFRCFEELNLQLHPRLTVLVGENGAGKTAILDAIASGLTPVLTHLSSANQRLSGPGIKDTDFRIESKVQTDGKKRIRKTDYARIALKTTDGLEWDLWRPALKHVQPPEKTGQTALNEHCAAIERSLAGDTPELLPVFAYYDAQRGGIDHPQRLRATSVNYDYPTAALAGALDSASDFKEILKWFSEAETAELRANRGVGIEQYQTAPILDAVRHSIELMLKGRYYQPHFNKDHKFVVLERGSEAPLQVVQISQGYQSMLALAADFARRLATANGHLPGLGVGHTASSDPRVLQILSMVNKLSPRHTYISPFLPLMAPAIMLVDEIDVHLHPAWQQTVLDDLMKVFPCTQFIVTTHSPQVLSTVAAEHIRVLADNRIYAAPNGTEGAESSRILKRVFGVETRPPANPVTKDLNEYMHLVYADQWQSEQAQALRKKLDAAFLGEEPRLVEADLYIENRTWELSLNDNGGEAL